MTETVYWMDPEGVSSGVYQVVEYEPQRGVATITRAGNEVEAYEGELRPATAIERIKAWAESDGVSSVLHGLHVTFWFWFPEVTAGATLVGIICGMGAFAFYWQRETGDRIEHPEKSSDSTWDLWVPWLAVAVNLAFLAPRVC